MFFSHGIVTSTISNSSSLTIVTSGPATLYPSTMIALPRFLHFDGYSSVLLLAFLPHSHASSLSDLYCMGMLPGFVHHLLHFFKFISFMSLVLFTLVGNVSGRSWIYHNFSPGFNLFVQSQLGSCFEFIALSKAFPLFWCSTFSSSFFIPASLLLSIFSNFNLVSLSTFSGVTISAV